MKKYVGLMLIVFMLLGGLVPASYAASVSITQTGQVVTATNGALTITYDLSTGRGNLSSAGITILANFYSDYAVSGNATRINSYDAAARTASWTSIGSDGYGTGGYKLTLTSNLNSGSTIVLNIYLYADIPYFLTDMQVQKGTSQTLDFLEPIASQNLAIAAGSNKKVFTTPFTNNNDFGVAPVNAFGSFTGTSYWVTSVFDDTTKNGFVAGAATVKNWVSAQYLAPASTANGNLTGFSVYNNGGKQSGTSVSSDKFFLGYYTDYRTGLEEFGAKYNVGEPHLTWSGGVPIGYNSWYALRFDDLTAENMYPLVDYVANNMQSKGYQYVNLDAGWENGDGDWTPNAAKWPVKVAGENPMKSFTNYVHSKGLKAGTYINPFSVESNFLDTTIPNTSYTFRQAVLRDTSGALKTTYIGTYALDTTHPGTQQYLRDSIQRYIDWGFDYIKADFLDFGLYEGNHYDSTKNGMQAYRLGMGILKDKVLAAGRPIFIDESISPLLPAAFAHGRRLGCDTELGVTGGGTTYTGYERQAFNAAASWFSNGTIWQYNDGDMEMVDNLSGNGSNRYDKNQARLLTNAVALAGGHWLVSEQLSVVPDDKMDIFRNSKLLQISQLGKAAKPVSMTNFYAGGEHSPSQLYLTDTNGDRIVGLSNWANTGASMTVTFADLGLSATTPYYVSDLYKGISLGTFTGSYTQSFADADATMIAISAANPSLPSAPVNISLGKTATASSLWSVGYEASKANDGSMATRWNSASGQVSNQWLEINFGASTTVNRVTLKEYGQRATQYQLQAWNGSSYVNLVNGNKLGFEKEINFAAVTTTKLRMNIQYASAEPSIFEFEAFQVSGNSGAVVDQDDSGASFSPYHDLRGQIQRMQVFKPSTTNVPRIDIYSYKNGSPKGPLTIDIVALDASLNPTSRLFTTTILPVNFPTTVSLIPIYTRLTGLTANGNYGIILRSPSTVESAANNYFGMAYSDSNPYANGMERLSIDGGVTWTTENSGNRDLQFTVYK
ncbi:coagulation factor 5/8 type domain-containing protein [Paenibacillus ferrarius]|uniref:Coagulation factor 5/8 type domain-containing protein n=1 Tax=Paenibacillus ferrarius TaxID=1469647 RepID=A0A1V4HPS7_9BACL|nr:discoidin domain-containing protein [Paenibacillus ferrarius]OPH60283.1 coagulation factor 5/8 type domain-containing protein [Paenibacillus ferrarius]